MLDETYYIYTGYTNDRIDDTPASLAGKKLGVVDPSNSKATLDAWIAEQGLDTQAIGYPTFDDMYAAYTTGRIDALVSSENIAEGVASIYPAQIVGRRPYYLAVAKDRDDLLANVNSAQEIMNNQDKVFLDSLRSRYSANSAVNDFMSADEHEWTQMHPSITVGYLDDYLPYCSKDANGEPTGLMTDVLTAAIQGLPGNWSPKVEYRCFDDQAELFAALADGQSYDGSIDTVAVNRHNLLQRAYTEEVFPDARVLEYESIDECIGAVEKGEAQGTIVNGLRAGALLESRVGLYRVQLPLTDDRCFGVAPGNGMLLRLLNRGLGIIGEDYGTNASYNYTKGLFTYTMLDFLRDHWVFLAILALGILLAIIASVAAHFRRLRRANEREAEQNRLLADALSQAERAGHLKDELLTNLSHDIRTPLNGILGALEVSRRSDDAELIERNTLKARDAARDLLGMVDDLLEMSALRSGDVELRREPFCPAQIFRSAEENASGRAQAARLNLNASLAPELEKTYLDSPSFMRQIVVNVLDNAVRYNVAGGGVQLTAGYREEAAEAGVAGTPFLTLAVADTGRGMDPEQLARLFEPFAQEENDVRSVYPGSGLGMSITKALVDLMGGSIGVTSEPGHGTVVEAAIPLTPAGDEKGKAGSDAPRIRAAGTGATSPVAAGAPAEAPLSHGNDEKGQSLLIIFLMMTKRDCPFSSCGEVGGLVVLRVVHPVTKAIVEDERDARGDPRDGIAQHGHVQRVVERHHGELPDDAQQARSSEHDKHGAQALPRPTDGARDVVVERVDHVEGAHVPHDLSRELGDLRIIDEEASQGAHVGEKHHRQRSHHQGREAQGRPEAAAHALVVSRAKVLRAEGGHGHAKRLRDHPDDGIDATAQAERRHDGGAKRVDGRLRDDVGHRVTR